jgi:hypothetical protein
MAINLIDTTRSLITPDVVSRISSVIGETPAKTQHVQSPKMASIALPCGTVLSTEEGFFTYNRANFLVKGSDSELPKRFVFDHLNFDSATTRLTPDSNQTVADTIAILKCCPKAIPDDSR